jgi:hypothetical protein
MPRRRFTLSARVRCAAAGVAQATPPANEDLVCRADVPELDIHQALRAISLDIRGVVPTDEEYAALDGQTDIPEATIDAWLDTEEFVQRAVRWHREMLWNGLGAMNFTSFRFGISRDSNQLWFRSNAQQTFVYRGGQNTVGCANTPAEFNGDGTIRTTSANGANVEGYVMVSPYWAPDTQIKVCAFDAQDTLVTSTGVDCSTNAGAGNPECGCGPNLRWCRQGDFLSKVARGLTEDVDRRIADNIRRNRPYTELFTSRKAFVNGPVVHFLRYMTGIPQDVNFRPLPYDLETLPDIPFTADTDFREVELPQGHAGILTSAAFLSRFSTNRGRANRIYNSFLCQPFQPPAAGIPVGSLEAQRELNLQVRDGCKYCHALLEPASAHWGRWPERGAGFLSQQQFPAVSSACTACSTAGMPCPTECTNFYFTRATASSERPYLGKLKAMYFLRDQHTINVDLGPRHLADAAMVENQMPACLARGVVERLGGRTVLPDERQYVEEELSRAFVQGGYSYRALVRAMVLNPTYRRVR